MNTNMKIIISIIIIALIVQTATAYTPRPSPHPTPGPCGYKPCIIPSPSPKPCDYMRCDVPAPNPKPIKTPDPTPIPTPEPTPMSKQIPLPVIVPDCPEIQCKDPRIKPTPEVPPNPRCIHWWCNPEIPSQTNNTVESQITPISTSISPMFIFGSSDVDRYNTFKSQLNDTYLSTRAKYYMDGILLEYGLNQTEFENKYIN